MLEKDGSHCSIAFLDLPNGDSQIMMLNFADKSEKFAVWRAVAEEVKRVTATGIMIINESWSAPINPKFDKIPLHKRLDRKEVLSLDYLKSTGETFSLNSLFERKSGKIYFESTVESTDIKMFILNPVREAWGLPLF